MLRSFAGTIIFENLSQACTVHKVKRGSKIDESYHRVLLIGVYMFKNAPRCEQLIRASLTRTEATLVWSSTRVPDIANSVEVNRRENLCGSI